MYVDPNTGGILFQVLSFLFVMFSGIVLIFSSRIKMFVARLRRKQSSEGESQEVDEEPANQ